MTKNPRLSIIVPTLNSERTLTACLESIKAQIYPGIVEIIITDGGSTDNTLKIAKRYDVKIYNNKLITAEAGKALGYKKANGEIIGFIDSDNVLVSRNWLKKIVGPFQEDREIVASESISFQYRKSDSWLTRYFSLLGMGDPVNLFIGWYDKYSQITGKWTGLNIKTKDRGNYLTFFLDKDIPTIGANGFFIRKNELDKCQIEDYLFDIDILKYLSLREKVKVAKIKIGITHLFSGNISSFIRKQKRRIRDYYFFSRKGFRSANTNSIRIYWGLLKYILATFFILPLLFQMIIGFSRKRDVAWLFHPIACWLTLIVYGTETIRLPFTKEMLNRKGWKQ